MIWLMLVGLKHFVWPTPDHTEDPHTAHWDSKAVVNDCLKASGVPSLAPRESIALTCRPCEELRLIPNAGTTSYYESYVKGTIFS